jgi:hypothetical protein
MPRVRLRGKKTEFFLLLALGACLCSAFRVVPGARRAVPGQSLYNGLALPAAWPEPRPVTALFDGAPVGAASPFVVRGMATPPWYIADPGRNGCVQRPWDNCDGGCMYFI